MWSEEEKQVTRELVKGEGLPQLLSRPFGGRVGGDIEVKNATTIMSQHQKHVKDLKPEGRHRDEVDGDQLVGMIFQESAPGLRRRLAAAHHVFAHAALPDVDAEFEQLTVGAGCTPTGIPPAHLADQVSDLAHNGRSSGLPPPHLPSPEPAKVGTMPSQDRLGLDDGQHRAPVAPEAGQPDPQQAVPRVNFGRLLADRCGTPV